MLGRIVRPQRPPLVPVLARWNTTQASSKPDVKPPDTSSSSPSPEPPTFTSSLPENVGAALENLREWRDKLAIAVRKHADEFTATTKSQFSHAGAHLNKMTGYDAIEALKQKVVDQEEKINQARNAAKEAKLAYERAVAQRSNSQREVNDLLHRKSTWTDQDVSRFTSLVREDHLYEQAETRARLAVDETESAVETEFTNLMHTILARYHEEQVWSDKIRSASTYGQMAALGLNVLVFILAIILVEPWKRRRLAQTFERKVEQMTAENALLVDNGLKAVQLHFDDRMVALGDELRAMLTTATAQKEEPVETIPQVEAEILPEQEPAEPMETMEQIQHLVKANGKLMGGVVSGAMAGWILHSLFS